PLPNPQTPHVRRRGAKRNPDSDLTRSLTHETGHHTEHASCRKHERERGKRSEHGTRESLLRPRAAKLLGENAKLVEGEIGVDALHRVSYSANRRRRITSR